MCSLEELSGVGVAECRESEACNKGDLIGSRRTVPGAFRYKHAIAKSEAMPGEKSDEVIVPLMEQTAQLFRRKGPLL